MSEHASSPSGSKAWIRHFFTSLGILCGVFVVLGLPYSLLWLYGSGDLSPEKAVTAQSDDLVLFGSGTAGTIADSLAYKRMLAVKRQPEIVILGSASGLHMRESVFSRPMLNMAGTADSLATLKRAADVLLEVSRPAYVLIPLDFWWFSDAWNARPERKQDSVSSGYRLSLDTVRAPWRWLVRGELGPSEFFAPLYWGFSPKRFGARAQFGNDGYGPDGSWYASSILTGREKADVGFLQTLRHEALHIAEFAPCTGIPVQAVDAFADIYYHLVSRGIHPLVYLPPLPEMLCDALKRDQELYPHMFQLRDALLARNIDVLDLSDSRSYEGVDCEFVSAVQPGEVLDIRVLRELTNRRHELLSYVNMEKMNRILNEWQGHAMVRDERVLAEFEKDYLQLGCLKKTR